MAYTYLHNYSGMTSNMFHIDSVANISPERNRSQLRNEKTTCLSLKIESHDSYDIKPMNDDFFEKMMNGDDSYGRSHR